MEVDVTELDNFQLENSYNVAVTISTALGSVSTGTVFGKPVVALSLKSQC